MATAQHKATAVLDAKLDEGRRQAARMKQSIAKLDDSLEKTSRSGSKAQLSLKKLGKSAAIAGAAVAAAAVASFRFVDSTTQQIDHLVKASRALGATSEEWQKLSFAAERAGVSQQSFERGLRTMVVGLQDAATKGTGPVKEGLDALGLAVEDLRGKNLSEQFFVLSDALKGVDDEQTKAAISAKIFGTRAGTEMANLLRTSTAEIKALGSELERAGGVIDNEVGTAAEGFQDDLALMDRQILKIKGSIATALIPVLKGAADGLVSLNETLGPSGTAGAMGLAASAAIALKVPLLGVAGAAATVGFAIGAMVFNLDERMAELRSLQDDLAELQRVDALLQDAIDQSSFGVGERAAIRLTGILRFANEATVLQNEAVTAANSMNDALTKGLGIRKKHVAAARELSELEQLLGRQADERFDAMVRAREAEDAAQADLDALLGPTEDTREFERQAELAQQSQQFERLGEVREEARLEREKKAEEEREKLHQRALERTRELEKAEREKAAKIAATQQASLAIARNVTGLSGAIADAAIKDDEKRARFKQRIQGIESIGIGMLELVKAAAAFASQNYVQGAMHVSAAALAFTQGGMLMAGNIRRGGGGAAGGASAFASGSAFGPAANGPPQSGELEGGDTETPGSAAPPAPQAGGSSGQTQQQGGTTFNGPVHLYGTPHREFIRAVDDGLLDLSRTQRLRSKEAS